MVNISFFDSGKKKIIFLVCLFVREFTYNNNNNNNLGTNIGT
jgi:hypothetical protein